jgi:hypothetical protein
LVFAKAGSLTYITGQTSLMIRAYCISVVSQRFSQQDALK